MRSFSEHSEDPQAAVQEDEDIKNVHEDEKGSDSEGDSSSDSSSDHSKKLPSLPRGDLPMYSEEDKDIRYRYTISLKELQSIKETITRQVSYIKPKMSCQRQEAKDIYTFVLSLHRQKTYFDNDSTMQRVMNDADLRKELPLEDILILMAKAASDELLLARVNTAEARLRGQLTSFAAYERFVVAECGDAQLAHLPCGSTGREGGGARRAWLACFGLARTCMKRNSKSSVSESQRRRAPTRRCSGCAATTWRGAPRALAACVAKRESA